MASYGHRKVEYIKWQNHAFSFYLAARLLIQKEQWGPACYCSNQALELMLKATLICWDSSFSPKAINHSFKKLRNTLKNKVPNAHGIVIPEYFYFEGRYQSTSRYPVEGKGIGIPASILDDLDRAFYDLLVLVPFQFNSNLIHALEGIKRQDLLILRFHNKQIRRMRQYLTSSLCKRDKQPLWDENRDSDHIFA